MAGRGVELPVSPPAGFSVYGLGPWWSGQRWLESFYGAYGDPVQGIALGHQTLDGDRVVMVDTFPRGRPAPPDGFLWWPDTRAVASTATNVLMGFNLPDQSVPRPPGFLAALAHRGEQLGAEVETWDSTSWQIDGETAPTRVCHFAGGWAGVVDVLPEVYVAAVGVGVSPEGLALADIGNGDGYGFDLREPLGMDALKGSRAALPADMARAAWERPEWHSDHLALMQ